MKEAAAFAEHARRFCEFIENASKRSLEERVLTARVLLVELYRTGLELPMVTPIDEEPTPSNTTRPPDWPGFERFEIYFDTFEVFDANAAACGCELSDDVLDIFFDVRRGLGLYPSVDAVWEWRFSFDWHWGDHAVKAIRVLHQASRDL